LLPLKNSIQKRQLNILRRKIQIDGLITNIKSVHDYVGFALYLQKSGVFPVTQLKFDSGEVSEIGSSYLWFLDYRGYYIVYAFVLTLA